MFEPIHYKTATLPLPKSISWSPLRRRFLVGALAVACFALSRTAQAQDGGYPNSNTVEGDFALATIIFGNSSANTGANNTAIGNGALFFNTTGSANTATGDQALDSNTTGNFNTATGSTALYNNTTGFDNTADRVQALYSNSSGYWNTASGVNALYHNTTGYHNAANGLNALLKNTTGHDNTASGYQALVNSTTGSNNIALGANGGSNLTNASNNIDIGAPGVAGESSHIRIGKVGTQTATFIAGIHGVTVASAVGVLSTLMVTSAQSPPRPASKMKSSRWTRRAKPFWRSSR